MRQELDTRFYAHALKFWMTRKIMENGGADKFKVRASHVNTVLML